MLLKARTFNAAHDISGCLLYHDGHFLQLIEGAEKEVKLLYENIAADKRHRSVTLLASERVVMRLFDKWSMLFNNLEDPSEEIEEKRRVFNEIFHDSGAVGIPSKSKFVLWKEMNALLYRESSNQA